jgi:acetyl esterase/lipase
MGEVLHPVPTLAPEGRLMTPLLRVLVVTLSTVPLAVPARADEPGKSAPPEKKFEVEIVKDIAYNGASDADPDKHKLDLYLPKGRRDFPVLFFVHGGTWKSGDRKQYERLGELYAGLGLGMVITNYRLTPKVQHPAHIQDVAKAFSWTCGHIAKYGGKADQIFCYGHSAGGHLVSLLATDESYLKAEKRSFADIRGVISISGVYTILPAGALANAFGKDREVCKKASPIFNVTANHPPFLILYGDADFPTLGWMAENMGKALEKAKCDVSTRKMENRDHFTIMYKQLESGDPVRAALLDFMAKHPDKK